MKSLSSVGLGLSLVFGCLLLALVAELYYLFWWKKRITNEGIEDGYSSPTKEFFYTFCCKKSSSFSSSRTLNPQELCSSETLALEPQAQGHVNSNKDLWYNSYGEDSIDAELMRLQQMGGPPRFLFTIKEETKEDLESEDGKSRGDRSRKGSRSRSLSDFFHTVETPYLTPLASPSYFTPPLTPIRSSQNQQGFHPLFELASDAEFNRLRSSPPPAFQFLRDAEDKLYRSKLEEEAEKGALMNDEFVQFGNGNGNGNGNIPSSSMFPKDEENGPFITIIVGKNKEKEHEEHQNVLQYPSSSSQVLPLASSPPKSTLSSNNKAFLNQKLYQINH